MKVSTVHIPGISELVPLRLEQRLQVRANAVMRDDTGPVLLKWDQERKACADQGKLKRALSASAGVSIELYNSASDKDEAGVFGFATENPEPGLAPVPRLVPSAEHGWLKYRFGAGLRAQAALDLGLGLLELDAGRSVEYAVYRRHALDEPLATSILEDLRDLPSALEVDDILRLGRADAVTLQYPGRVALTLELDDSLFASSNLRPISALFGLRGALFLQIQSGFTFNASLSITDDMRLCFVGGGGLTHVSLRKADQSAFTARAGASVSVGFSAETQAALLSHITRALFNAGVADIDALLARTLPAQLLAGEPELLQQLTERLGIGGSLTAQLDSLRGRMTAWKSRLTSALVELLQTRIALGFNYEYSRVASSGSLFEAMIDAATLRELHPSLLAFDLGPVLNLALLDESRPVEQQRLRNFFYLHERRVTRIASRGFTLGIGKWLQLSGKFTGSRTIVEQGDERGQRKLAWISTRSISSAFNDAKSASTLTLRADTDAFLTAPRMGDIKFALALESLQQQLDRDQLTGFLDLAALWGVLSPSAISQQLPKLLALIPVGVEIDTLVSIRLSDRLVRATSRWLLAHSNHELAALLARSLPYWPRHDARAGQALREQVYSPIFRKFLDVEGSLNFKPERLLRNMLTKHYPTLAETESRSNAPRHLAFVGYATQPDAIGHRAIGIRLDTLRTAFAQLLQAPEHSALDMNQVLDQLYAQQRSITERSFTIRFFGALLAEVARSSGYDEGFVATACLAWKGLDGGRCKLVLSSGP